MASPPGEGEAPRGPRDIPGITSTPEPELEALTYRIMGLAMPALDAGKFSMAMCAISTAFALTLAGRAFVEGRDHLGKLDVLEAQLEEFRTLVRACALSHLDNLHQLARAEGEELP